MPHQEQKEYTETQLHQAYQSGIKEGETHKTPSLDTLKFISETQKSMDKINSRLDNIEDKLENIPTRDEMELANRKLLEETLCKVDDKYATKDRVGILEKIVYGLIGVILTGVVVAILNMVLKN